MTRRVLITGSAGHLGRALRLAFEARGDVVIGVDKYGSSRSDRPDWVDHTCDLDELTTTGYAELPTDFDVVVCNAKTAKWHAHEYLARQARQCIVNVGSIYGVLGNDPAMYPGTGVDPTPAWYAASKGALVALTKWQATNLAPVRSNCVCPGGIFRDHSDEFRARYSTRVPLGRMATEADIVGPIVWLCSDEAAYITGQTLMVDGGYSCW